MNIEADLAQCLETYSHFAASFRQFREKVASLDYCSDVGTGDDDATFTPAFNVTATTETRFTVSFLGRTFEVQWSLRVERRSHGHLECDERALVTCDERTIDAVSGEVRLERRGSVPMERSGTFIVMKNDREYALFRTGETVMLLLCGFTRPPFALPALASSE